MAFPWQGFGVLAVGFIDRQYTKIFFPRLGAGIGGGACTPFRLCVSRAGPLSPLAPSFDLWYHLKTIQ